MITMTLLEVVQEVLASMESDAVSSISDTEESELVAGFCKEIYYDLLGDEDWPWLQEVSTLTASGSTSYPTQMQLPANMGEIIEVRYKTTESGATDEDMTEIEYMAPADFLDFIYRRRTSASNITEVTEKVSGTPLFIQTDKAPQFYTSFDDEWLTFDSYDSVVDTTLATAKTMVRGIKAPTWTVDDAFTPDLPGRFFPLYLQRCISICNERIKQKRLALSEKSERRKFNRLRRKKRVSDEVRPKTYGRR